MRNKCNSIKTIIKSLSNPLASNIVSSIGSGLIFLASYNFFQNINTIYCVGNNCQKNLSIPIDRIQNIVYLFSVLVCPTLITNLCLNLKLLKINGEPNNILISNNNNFRDLITKKNLLYAAKISCPAIIGITPAAILVYSNDNANPEDILTFSLGFIAKHSFQNHLLYKKLSSKAPASIAVIHSRNRFLTTTIAATPINFQTPNTPTTQTSRLFSVNRQILTREIQQPIYNLTNEQNHNVPSENPINQLHSNHSPSPSFENNNASSTTDSPAFLPSSSPSVLINLTNLDTANQMFRESFENFSHLNNQTSAQPQSPPSLSSLEQLQSPRQSPTPRLPSSYQMMHTDRSRGLVAIV